MRIGFRALGHCRGCHRSGLAAAASGTAGCFGCRWRGHRCGLGQAWRAGNGRRSNRGGVSIQLKGFFDGFEAVCLGGKEGGAFGGSGGQWHVDSGVQLKAGKQKAAGVTGRL
jgi:hypothetical protein